MERGCDYCDLFQLTNIMRLYYDILFLSINLLLLTCFKIPINVTRCNV